MTWTPIIVTYLIDFLCVSVFSNRAIDVYFLYIKNRITKIISTVNLLCTDMGNAFWYLLFNRLQVPSKHIYVVGTFFS